MMQKKFQKLSGVLPRALLLAAATGLPATTMAAGFQITEQSVSGLGRAFAGGAAIADDASTIFYNPAGLTELDGELLLGASLISLGADYDKTRATTMFGDPLTGGEGGDVGKLGGVPILYYVKRINEDWVFGMGVNAPFGLSTDYDPDWVGRYQGIYSNVSTVNLNPSLAWQVNDNWSLGFGLDFMHMRVKLTSAVDYGTICYAQVNPVTCNAVGFAPQQNDGLAVVEGDGWGYGFNIGARWSNDVTSVGLHYRSGIDEDLEGDATFVNAPALFTAQGTFVDTGISAEFKAPESIELAITHRINDSFLLSGSINYTGWDSFQELVVNYDNFDAATGAGQPPTEVPENWENVMRYSVGLDWTYSPEWTFRAGVAMDETPVVDEWRTPRLPDSDRTWLAFGATWHLGENLEMDAAYAHLFLDGSIPINSDQLVRNPETGALDVSLNNLQGSYDASADIAGLELRWRF